MSTSFSGPGESRQRLEIFFDEAIVSTLVQGKGEMD